MTEKLISEADKQHFCEQVFDREKVLQDPFTFCVVDGAFSSETYAKILANLPSDKQFTWDTNKSMYKNRGRLKVGRMCSLSKDPFWNEFLNWMMSQEMVDKWVAKYEPELRKMYDNFDDLKFSIRGFFNRDLKGYQIGPHCDSPAKCITMLFYFPPDESQRAFGTTIYQPKAGHKPKNDRLHHQFKDYNEVTTVEMVPNRVMEFVVTDDSWHGVKPVTEKIVRNSIQLNICPSKK